MDSNTRVHITSDGSITTYNEHGVRIYDLSGRLPTIHRVLKLSSLNSKDRKKIPNEFKIRNPIFYFQREDTLDHVEWPIHHVIEFAKYISDNDDTFVMNLLMQIPK